MILSLYLYFLSLFEVFFFHSVMYSSWENSKDIHVKKKTNLVNIWIQEISNFTFGPLHNFTLVSLESVQC